MRRCAGAFSRGGVDGEVSRDGVDSSRLKISDNSLKGKEVVDNECSRFNGFLGMETGEDNEACGVSPDLSDLREARRLRSCEDDELVDIMACEAGNWLVGKRSTLSRE